MSMRTMVTKDFGPEAQIIISAHAQRKMAKNGRKRFSVAEIAVSYRISGWLNPMALL